MKTHPFFAASLTMVGLLSVAAFAQEAGPEPAAPAAPAASAAPAAVESPESVKSAEVEAPASEDAEAPETAPPQKLDLEALRQQGDEPLGLLPADEEGIPMTLDPGLNPDAALPSEPEESAAPEKARPLKKGSADQLRQAIRIRELKTQVLNDPASAPILEQRALAKRATTPEGRRAALRNYYTLLARKIISLDPALKGPVEGELYSKLRALEQRRVRPSLLIEPIPAVEGSRSADYAAPPSL